MPLHPSGAPSSGLVGTPSVSSALPAPPTSPEGFATAHGCHFRLLAAGVLNLAGLAVADCCHSGRAGHALHGLVDGVGVVDGRLVVGLELHGGYLGPDVGG